MLQTSGVLKSRVRLVTDSKYAPEVRSLARETLQRFFAVMFIVDVSSDRSLVVDALLRELAATAWRGVDTRIVIGGSRTNLAIAEASDAACERAGELGIPCRWLTRRPERGSHAKFVVADDRVLLGSHNWSPGAFTRQLQESVVVESPALAAYLARTFEDLWSRAGPEGIPRV